MNLSRWHCLLNGKIWYWALGDLSWISHYKPRSSSTQPAGDPCNGVWEAAAGGFGK